MAAGFWILDSKENDGVAVFTAGLMGMVNSKEKPGSQFGKTMGAFDIQFPSVTGIERPNPLVFGNQFVVAIVG